MDMIDVQWDKWRWKDSLPELNIVNAQLGLNKVSPSGLSRIQSQSFAKYSTKSRGTTLLNVVSVIS
jgi:hypothetical protein